VYRFDNRTNELSNNHTQSEKLRYFRVYAISGGIYSIGEAAGLYEIMTVYFESFVMKPKRISRIISGGQTGADRAAFDFALENNIEIGGFVPKNRLAEDGVIAEKYTNLHETESVNPTERTELNVKNSDATLILSHGSLCGGSLLTVEFAEKHRKPFLHIDFSALKMDEALEKTASWLGSIACENLNVAGARASEDAEIYDKTGEFLRKLLERKVIK
jgi:hypothetical protein